MARILVVDDEGDMRMALGNVLHRMGHDVYEAGDGPSALQFLARERADLVLLDIRLPGMDGVQILRQLREKDRATPVIMVTGYGSVESAVEVMQLGASHYLAKPFSNHELKETIDRVLQGRTAPLPAGAKLPSAGDAAAPARTPLVRAAETLPAAVVLRRPPSRPWLAPALVLGGGLVATLFWALNGAHGARDLALPHKNATALVWRDGALWTADWLTQTVYELKPAARGFEIVRSFPLPGVHITGMALTKDSLYLCDSWKKVIQERKLDSGLSLLRSFPSPGPKPAGLFWDGRYLWSSDAGERRIYQHEIDAELAVLASHEAPGKAPAALFKDEEFFWSADSESRLLYQHRLDKDLKVLASYSLEKLDSGSSPLSTFVWSGAKLWLARDGSPRLLVRPLSRFHRLETRKRS